MQLSKGLWAVAFGLVTGAALLAAPPSGDSGSSTATPQRQTRVRLTRPWNQLTDLTDDEKKKILDVHGKAAEQIRQIREKEHADILALLSEDQKKEVAQIEATDRTQRRGRRNSASSSSSSNTSQSGAQTSQKGQ
ncbi:MAG TPA: hypothetical protein VN541_00385 [Tepidisphaeraceae bacterium]|nr:hypothetical protein [Tepidisphaeraceae bacterium]